VPARYLRFVAVHDTYQGVQAPDGQRCSDLLMHAVHNDILARHPSTEAVLVRVHPQHAGSITLLERNAYVPVTADAGAHPLHVRAL
jgi:hypothetical protein